MKVAYFIKQTGVTWLRKVHEGFRSTSHLAHVTPNGLSPSNISLSQELLVDISYLKLLKDLSSISYYEFTVILKFNNFESFIKLFELKALRDTKYLIYDALSDYGSCKI